MLAEYNNRQENRGLGKENNYVLVQTYSANQVSKRTTRVNSLNDQRCSGSAPGDGHLAEYPRLSHPSYCRCYRIQGTGGLPYASPMAKIPIFKLARQTSARDPAENQRYLSRTSQRHGAHTSWSLRLYLYDLVARTFVCSLKKAYRHRHFHLSAQSHSPPNRLFLQTSKAYDPEQTKSSSLPICPAAVKGLKKGARRQNASYELWFDDETRFALLPYLTGIWAPLGNIPEIPTPGKNQQQTVYAAVRYTDGKFLYHLGGAWFCGTDFIELLSQLVSHARRVGKRIILVLDNASFHVGRLASAFFKEHRKEIMTFWLPSYSCQLNLIEHLWHMIKRTFFANFLAESFEAFQQRIHLIFDLLRTKPKVVLQAVFPNRYPRLGKAFINMCNVA